MNRYLFMIDVLHFRELRDEFFKAEYRRCMEELVEQNKVFLSMYSQFKLLDLDYNKEMESIRKENE